MNHLLQRFESTVSSAHAKLRELKLEHQLGLSETKKWNEFEILNHLIDSCLVNYQRVIISCTTSTLRFDGYEQDKWVNAQNKVPTPWVTLLELWVGINQHMIRMMSNMDESQMKRKYISHNLHKVGFKTFDPDVPESLYNFMIDYLDHVDHHLRQIYAKHNFDEFELEET